MTLFVTFHFEFAKFGWGRIQKRYIYESFHFFCKFQNPKDILF